MQFGIGADTFSARLSGLPVTEHAILLNRFKFLDLVQRVAAADVAEMVQTVGLEALLYKGTLEKIPFPQMLEEGDGKAKKTTTPPRTTKTAEKKTVGRRGVSQRRAANAVAADVRGDAPPHSRRRFSTQKEEQEFIKRMSRPQKAFDPLDYMIRKPPRGGFKEAGENEVSRHSILTAAPHHVVSNAVAPTISSISCYSEVAPPAAAHDNFANNADDDNVVVESSVEQPHPVSSRLKVQIADPTHDQGMWNPEEQQRAKGEPPKEQKAFYPQEGVKRVALSAEEISLPKNLTGFHTRTKSEGTAIQLTQNARNSGLRTRGSFAPKAKPKAAAEVSRVPLEVIRHASALLANKKNAPPPAPPVPQFSSPTPQVASNNLFVNEQNAPAPLLTSNSSLPTPAVPSSKQGELDVQHANTPSCTTTALTLSDSALAELASSVERMLQDHQVVLDGIVRNGMISSTEPLKELLATDKRLHGEVVAADDDVDVAHQDNLTSGSVARHILPNRGTGAKSSHTLRQDYDALGDISDEEDEILLVSRIQRKLGSIDREMTAIEQREKELSEHVGNFNRNGENDRGKATQKEQGERRVILNMRGTQSKNSAVSGRQHGRRRGEMPRAIVDRICSFQKENHEHIRYTEKQWNTSHVTEQVFAQRLTETLFEDAFQEVLEEVGSILDTYVEGLALHELQ